MIDICALGEKPPLGDVPTHMHAFAVRQNRFGQPKDAWQREILPTPSIKDDEVLVYVMASGINYNNVWAALGSPLDVIAERQKMGEPEDFHAGGSDCSGIVWSIGKDVTNVKVGDEVIVHSGWWRADDPWVKSGKDPMLSESTRIWGYQTNYGSYCQFARAQGHQCMPKPKRLTWVEAGCFLLCASTAYRMLNGWAPNVVEPGDVVLVWGAAGGLGSLALEITRALGGRPVAVVSDELKKHFAMDHGAVGAINRHDFKHWGPMPDTKDAKAYGEWAKGARAFGKAIWDVIGEKTSPRIVFEHPGEATLPTSEFVCATGGMIVICAGTTGYNVTLDLRYHWMRQKRFQGSHLSNDNQAAAVIKLVDEAKVDPCLSHIYQFDEIAECHQLMLENRHPYGNMGVLVNATDPGLGAAPPWVNLERGHKDTKVIYENLAVLTDSLSLTAAVCAQTATAQTRGGAASQTAVPTPAPGLTPEQIKASEDLAAKFDEGAAKEQARLSTFKTRPLAGAIQRTFNVFNNYLVVAAEMMPEADYGFRPTPDVRTFGEQINHSTSSHYSFCNQAGLPAGITRQSATPASQLTTKPAIVKALKDSIAYCDSIIAAASEAWLMEPAPAVGGSSSGLIEGIRAHAFLYNNAHDAEDYGTITTYLRMKGLVPPSTAIHAAPARGAAPGRGGAAGR